MFFRKLLRGDHVEPSNEIIKYSAQKSLQLCREIFSTNKITYHSLDKKNAIYFKISQGYLCFVYNNHEFTSTYLMFRNTFGSSHNISHQSCDDQCLETSHDENSS